MPVPTDPYNFTAGEPASGDQVDARFAPLYAALNGALDSTNLAASVRNGYLKLATVADRKVAFGSGVITFSAAQNAAAYVTHGLGATPVVAFCQPTAGGSFWQGFMMSTNEVGATQFRAEANWMDDTTVSGTMNFFWVAIG